MTPRKPVPQMSDSEWSALFRTLSRDDLDHMISFLRGWDPDATEAALQFAERMRDEVPPENPPKGEHPYPPGVMTCEAVSEVGTTCNGLDGHPLPHRDANGFEWIDDGWPDGYDPEFDNCAGSPGCGDERVLFRWNAVDQSACPRCFENVYGGPPDPAQVIKLPARSPRYWPSLTGRALAGNPDGAV